jgi:CRISPR-associated exonuclease Cas4
VSGKRRKRKEGQRYSRYDPEELFAVTPTDVKQYIFCPLITYYRRVLRLKPLMNSQQEQSKQEHERIRKLEERRLIPLKIKEFRGSKVVSNLFLQSKKVNARGKLDLLIITPWGEFIPVDYKFSRSEGGRAWIDHKYQICFYALLLEENFERVVRRGLVCYMPERRVVVINITSRLKRKVKEIIEKILEMDVEQEPPTVRRNSEKCSGGCGYKWVCYG